MERQSELKRILLNEAGVYYCHDLESLEKIAPQVAVKLVQFHYVMKHIPTWKQQTVEVWIHPQPLKPVRQTAKKLIGFWNEQDKGTYMYSLV